MSSSSLSAAVAAALDWSVRGRLVDVSPVSVSGCFLLVPLVAAAELEDASSSSSESTNMMSSSSAGAEAEEREIPIQIPVPVLLLKTDQCNWVAAYNVCSWYPHVRIYYVGKKNV